MIGVNPLLHQRPWLSAYTSRSSFMGSVFGFGQDVKSSTLGCPAVVSQNRVASKLASGNVSHISSMVRTRWLNRRRKAEGGTLVRRMSALDMWKMYRVQSMISDVRRGRERGVR